MTTTSSTDRIEKQIVLKAPISKVWRSIADAEQFGSWFGCRFDGEFGPGRTVDGRMTEPPGFEDIEWDIVIERMEPERVFSFRWHPGQFDPDLDYSQESRTLVTFTLEEVPDGTRLTLVESGFDALSPGRRKGAFTDNDSGWSIQMGRIAAHVEAA